jgi:hypothetical protein
MLSIPAWSMTSAASVAADPYIQAQPSFRSTLLPCGGMLPSGERARSPEDREASAPPQPYDSLMTARRRDQLPRISRPR